MRFRLLSAVLAAAALLAVPAAANAKLTIGISENTPAMFSDPLFGDLGARHARVVMAYNVMTSGDHELARVTEYLNAARAAGVTPLVTFQHATGDSSICGKRRNFRRSVCRLPSQKQYRSNIRKFFAAFPWVKVVAPWNEVNHFTQPTSRNPKRAAQFTNIAKKACKRCTIVAADVLDQANDPAARRPKYGRTIRYIKRFRRALKVPRKICGLHNYSDVNRFRDTGTRQIIRALGCRQIWLTETGGLYDFGSFWTKRTRKGCKNRSACQVKATKYMFKLARKNRRIKRLYVYTYFGNVTPRFDAGLVDKVTGKPRRAFREVKKRV
ncbi:MAG: hypothetical protein ACRDPC_04825 [Solirubrobacteraceae bacterium]